MSWTIAEGSPAAPGLRLTATGANVAVLSAHAERIELCLFDPDGRESARLPLPYRTGDMHHAHVEGIGEGQLYALRAHGPWDPAAGHRFNPAKLLLDPWALAFTGDPAWDQVLCAHAPDDPLAPDPRDSAAVMPRCIAVPDRPKVDPAERPRRAPGELVVYEAHVCGLTRLHPEIPEPIRGTYEALGHPAILAHLQRQGVTALELLPVHAFADEPHLVRLGLTNYWGYNTYGFFAPSPRYMGPKGADGLREAIAALHGAGIEVILDVVYNHSAEGDEDGPCVMFRGLDDASWYRHHPDAPGGYSNETGCGNTLDLSKPFAQRLALDSLRWWAERMGVDGFRFDLAPVLARGRDGEVDMTSDFLATLRADPALAELHLIAEPWDIGPGGWQTGAFPPGWRDWNDGFRDAVRRFWKNDARGAQDLASALLGSAEAFDHDGRPAWSSVNFVSAHDGFTLADLTMYAERRNWANGEDNRDGHAHEDSDPMGPEGPGAPEQEAARARRRRNLLLTVFAAQGAPMLRAGDEIGQSQGGNNNAYCQDNETTWIDWLRGDDDLAAFAAAAARLRARLPALRQPLFLHGDPRADGAPEIEWAALAGGAPAWDDDGLPGLVLVLRGAAATPAAEADPAPVALALNAGAAPSPLELPAPGEGLRWRLALDTAHPHGTPLGSGAPPLEIGPDHALVFEAVPADPAPTRLAREVGIFARYYEITGTERVASDATRDRLLAAMDLPTEAAEAEAALDARHAAARARRLPREAVVEAADGQGGGAPWPLPAPLGWTLHLEDGESLSGGVGEPVPPLPAGLHLLEAGGEEVLLAAAPPAAPSVEAVAGQARVWGLTGAVYALTGPRSLGEGDFADLAEAAASAAGLGAAFLGVNPIHALGVAYRGTSPYSPSTRVALDARRVAPRLVPGFSPDLLPEGAAEALAAWAPEPLTDPELHARQREPALRALFDAAWSHPGAPGAEAFDDWLSDPGAHRVAFAVYEALSELHGDDWRAWPEALRDPASPAVAAFGESHAEAIRYHAWLQWLAETQLAAAQTAATEAGMALGLYLDIAVGVRPGGAETWANPTAFARGVSLGAPPDALNSQGQAWGLAPYSPEGLRRLRYAPFREMLRSAMRAAGAVRIDHVIGLDRCFWVPEDGAPGGYVKYPTAMLMALVRIEAARHGCVVVGEDLGTVPDGLRESLAESNLHGCAILQFEGGPHGYRNPKDFAEASLAAFGTHDTPTLAGWWAADDADLRLSLGHIDAEGAEAVREERAACRVAMCRLLAEEDLLPEGLDPEAPPALADAALREAIHALLARGSSALMAVQIDDAFGVREPQNVPGTTTEAPNWRRRHPVAAAEIGGAEVLRALAQRLEFERSS
ncbi:glycogen debranching protein GlgX [Albimonas sp. CAU 1670]|uniref:glycogen debranching protein GlgX n=1 Tax=Albimonas sp. CAU 1670 TaxID=3032599 RepID=UPI0023DAD59F|nr:glycogen debranching protein GlgX [Albimonas sp. CAU 1670]MDF2231970.1 glycogen debranching protein GlgX [Albimonas sp. CAU 1670]